jgi:hypothetical protein
VVERFKAFADGHYLIKRFSHGQIDVADIMKDVEYPWMHIVPVSMNPSTGTRSFSFDIIFADLPRDKEEKTEYQRESLSDCIRLAEDLLAEIQNGNIIFGEDVELEQGASISPFMEEYTHVLTGVTLSLTMTFPWNWDACTIPSDWSAGGTGSGGTGGGGASLLLKVNDVDNVLQNILNITEGSNMTITDLGDGRVRFDSTGGGGGGSVVSTEYNINHTTATGNQYIVGDYVFYSGNVYRCIASNDALLPTNTTYWTLVGAGNRLRQSPVDWDASSGDYQILNKPTIPTATSELTNDSGFITIGDVPTQVNADWNSVSGVSEILNKPTIPDSLDDLTDVYINVGTLATGQTLIYDSGSGYFKNDNAGGVTSVGLTMPTAFSVSGSPVTTSGTIGVTASGSVSQYIDGTGALQTFPTLPPVIGDMTKAVYDTDDDGVVDSAERIEIVVRNSTGVTLTKGQVVYLSGATGFRPNAVLADASTEATSSKTIGLVTANIANNADGFVAVNGTLHDLNTSAFSAGDTLWLSETAGAYQANTPPSEPAHAVFIGYVARAHPNLGRIVLAIQNGYELNELHGVSVPTPSANDMFYYDGGASLWQSRQLTASHITNSTDVGRNLLTLPNPSAISYLRVNADNSVSSLTATQLKTDLNIRDTFTIRMGVGPIAVLDNQTYYFGEGALTLSTSPILYNNMMAFNCKLIGAQIMVNNLTATATSEASTLSFRINNTTDVLLSSAVVFTGAPPTSTSFVVTGLNQSIAANDEVNIKWQTPNWATNPTGAQLLVTLFFERT